jgi:hypothetical protein
MKKAAIIGLAATLAAMIPLLGYALLGLWLLPFAIGVIFGFLVSAVSALRDAFSVRARTRPGAFGWFEIFFGAAVIDGAKLNNGR